MKKRLLSMLLAVVLICSFAVPALAAGNMERFKIQNTYESGLFRDVSVNEWYYDSIKLAYELGLVKGVSEGKFNPNGSITLMETVALACRLHSIYHGGTGEFEQHGHWYEVYYEYAIENKLLDSYHVAMDHSAVALRQDFAAILRGALPDAVLAPINEIERADIPDAFAISEENLDSVLCLYAAGILTGSDAEGTFMPNSDIQRCEVAAIVARMAIPSMRKTVALGQPQILLPAEELYINTDMTIYIPVSGDEDITIVCNFDKNFVEAEFGEWDGEKFPLTLMPKKNGTTTLEFYLEEYPGNYSYMDLNISGV